MDKLFISWGRNGVVRVCENEKIFIGRNDECKVRLCEDTSVSRKHCSLLWDGQRIVLKDEGSRNGTFLGEQCIAKGQEVELSEGDIFRCGQSELQVHFDDNPTAELPSDSPTMPM